MTAEDVRATFRRRFGGEPTILAQAPGRVNLIGEHTDYNAGLVLPAAIDRYVWAAARRTSGNTITIFSMNSDETAAFPADHPGTAALPRWARYGQGVADTLVRTGFDLMGMEAVVGGNLPIEAGLSSSAALELASALAFEACAGHVQSPRENALLCWRAEVEVVGVPCGIMDQFAAALSRRGHALLIDCRTLETRDVLLPSDWVIAVCDTGVRRALYESAYAQRREECRRAVEVLRTRGLEIQTLRDLAESDWPCLDDLPDPFGRRARHVVRENQRVLKTIELLGKADERELCELFRESHASLRDDYDVSSAELDAMVEAALDSPGVIAARMTGAGFGGAVVATVRRPEREAFLSAAAAGYTRRTRKVGTCIAVESADGARLIS